MYWCVCVSAGMATVYVRYKQVEALTGEAEIKLNRLNRFGLVLGLISSFGMCVVANFQVSAAGPGSVHGWAVCVCDRVERVSSESVCVCVRAEDHAVLHAPGGGGADLRRRGALHPGSDAALAQDAASHPQQGHLPGPPRHRSVDAVQHHQQYPSPW